MKHAIYILLGLLQPLFWSCNGKPSGKSQLLDVDTSSQFRLSAISSDTLQFLEEGENEDNVFGVFINQKLDTFSIVWDELRKQPQRDAMYKCQWTIKEVISGGDAEVRYEQAFMLSSKSLSISPFVDNSIPKEQLRLKYLFNANGGTIGYLNNGTVVGCPCCEPGSEDALALLRKPPMRTYREMEDGRLLVNGTTYEYPEEKEAFNEWLIFDSPEKWVDYIQPTPEFVGKTYKARIGDVCMEASEPAP